MRGRPKLDQRCRVCGHRGDPSDFDKHHKHLCKRCSSEKVIKRKLAGFTDSELKEYAYKYQRLVTLAIAELGHRQTP